MPVPDRSRTKKESVGIPPLISIKQIKTAYWTLFYSIGAILAIAVLWHNSLNHPGLCPIMILFAIESVTWAWLSREKWSRDVW